MSRPDLSGLLARRALVTITNPVHGMSWTGRVIAVHYDPGVIIEQESGFRQCLPQAFTITEVTADPPTAGDMIRTAREAAGLTQGQLAARIGYSQTSVSYKERMAREVTVSDLMAFAAGLGVDPASLLPPPCGAERRQGAPNGSARVSPDAGERTGQLSAPEAG